MRALSVALTIGAFVIVCTSAPPDAVAQESCGDRCGECLETCCCDSFCFELGDCCPDFADACPVTARVGELGCPEYGVDSELVASCSARAEAAACVDGAGDCPLADTLGACVEDPLACPLPLPVWPLLPEAPS